MASLEQVTIRVDDIHADESFNCRGNITPMDVADLANDIKRQGLLQPIVVMQYSDAKVVETGKHWKLLAGFRRHMAHRVNKMEFIDARVVPNMSEADATILNLTENLKRADLNIMQEARAIKRLYDYGVGEVDCAERIGKSRGWVQIRYMLLKLPVELQSEVEQGYIKQTDIRELYTIMGAAGVDACFNEAKRVKEARLQGRTRKIKMGGHVKDPNTKRIRKKSEITGMTELILDTIGPCFGSRVAAWCSGEISDFELFKACEEEANIYGKAFTPPY
jgi:ParB family chromosome partitioning protein